MYISVRVCGFKLEDKDALMGVVGDAIIGWKKSFGCTCVPKIVRERVMTTRYCGLVRGAHEGNPVPSRKPG